MSTIHWAFPFDYTWASYPFWTQPVAGDDVYVDANSAILTFTSTISTSYSFNTLTVNSANATVVQTGGYLTVGTSVSVAAGVLALNGINIIPSLSVSGTGILDVGSGLAMGLGTVHLSGGLLRFSSTGWNFINDISIDGASQTISAMHGVTVNLGGNLLNGYSPHTQLLVLGAAGQDGVIDANFRVDYYQESYGLGAYPITQRGIEIAAGEVVVGASFAAAAFSVSDFVIDGGAVLDMNGNTMTIQRLYGAGSLTNTGFQANLIIQSLSSFTSGTNVGYFTGVISGALSLTIAASISGVAWGDAMTLVGANTYTGSTTLVSGLVDIANASAFSSGRVTFGAGDAVTVEVTASMTFSNPVTIGAGATAVFGALDADVLTMGGSVTFAGAMGSLGLGFAGGYHGAVIWNSSGIIHGFTHGDTIAFGNYVYSAGDHVVFQSAAGGVQTFVLEDVANTVLTTLNFAGDYSASLFTLADDGAGHPLLGLSHGLAPFAATHDFNGNGVSDVVLQSGGSIIDWTVVGCFATAGHALGAGLNGWSIVGAGDFNGDGVADVLLQAAGLIVDWSMSASGSGLVASGGVAGVAGSGFSVVATGDFNNDGYCDVVLQNGGVIVDWLMNNGVAVAGNLLGSGLSGWSVVGSGDFNADGTSDLLLQNGGSVVVWNMGNGGVATGALVGSAPAGWTVVGAGDFNGDGTTDVLLQNGGAIVDWIVLNDVAVAGNLLGTGLAGWSVVATGDYNGDGTSDILLQNGGSVVDWAMSNGHVLTGNILGAAGGYTVKA